MVNDHRWFFKTPTSAIEITRWGQVGCLETDEKLKARFVCLAKSCVRSFDSYWHVAKLRLVTWWCGVFVLEGARRSVDALDRT